eukprot:scpid49874/ scgid4706/ 
MLGFSLSAPRLLGLVGLAALLQVAFVCLPVVCQPGPASHDDDDHGDHHDHHDGHDGHHHNHSDGDSDTFYRWVLDDGDDGHGVNVSGLTPTQHSVGKVLQIKLPFAFPFYSRAQTTVYAHPEGFIFPHRLSDVWCPRASCYSSQVKTSYIAPLLGAKGHNVTISVYSVPAGHQGPGSEPAVHVLWTLLHGGANCTASSAGASTASSCHHVQFSATLHRAGDIDFEYVRLPPWSAEQQDVVIGLRDSIVFAGYGTLHKRSEIELLSSINVNANNSEYNTARSPVHVHFTPRLPLIVVDHTIPAKRGPSFEGSKFGIECHNVTKRASCIQLDHALECIWCAPAQGESFAPFCGHLDDKDPQADILFSNRCAFAHDTVTEPETHLDEDQTGPSPFFIEKSLGHEAHYAIHSSMQTVALGVPMRLIDHYTSDGLVVLPFKFPFFKHTIDKLHVSHHGLLAVPGDDCFDCADHTLSEDPFAGSYISPLAALWDFEHTDTRRGQSSGMLRYDAVDGSFVHFAWRGARLTEYRRECAELHCRACACPFPDLPPASFSATLFQNGTIVFGYENFTTPLQHIPFDLYYEGYTGIHDVLVRLRNPKTSVTDVLHYGFFGSGEIAKSVSPTVVDDFFRHYRSVSFVPTLRPTCNSAGSSRASCEAQPGGHPCLWCKADLGYTRRSERTFCSDAPPVEVYEVKTPSLNCTYFAGQSPKASKSGAGSSTGVIVGAVLGGLVALALVAVAVVWLRKRKLTADGHPPDFAQFKNDL